MTVHLSTSKDSGRIYCHAVDSWGIKTSTSPSVADCLPCLRKALHQSKSGLHVIKGVLAEALPD
jgi:hypothetical protein